MVQNWFEMGSKDLGLQTLPPLLGSWFPPSLALPLTYFLFGLVILTFVCFCFGGQGFFV